MAVDAARAKSLFLAASDLSDLAERGAYLERECGEDAELRGRVEALLRANDAAPLPPAEAEDGTSAHIPNRQPQTEDHGDPTACVGTVLAGKYKLIEEIGEGAMGSVYMAQQTEPVKRAVAVKVIKAGMDSKAVLARFEAERQALAMMDHPNIAKVLDAGTTGSPLAPREGAPLAEREGYTGRPFFVMELVKGTPITQFCDERKLTPRQRLELFVPVCQAIQHAHQKGIIHRDIKPSNVLVAMYDDKPVPKVIDFGVAKAAGQTLTDKTLMTGFGAVVGTPEYMSPEQANLNNVDIDTRSDVYSLGVLLYELLTGTTPVDRKSLGKAALLEVLRIVREVEAPRPSAKLSTIDTLPSVAANRGTEPAKLSRLMRGELDWLVMKALEKDRTRRYDTANGLARDIQRYLADEVVEARPPSTGYRLKKFVRRHKGQVIAASLVLLSLLGGIAGMTWGLLRAEQRRVEAEQARADEAHQRELAEEKEQEAQREKENALKAAAAETAALAQTRRRLEQIEKGVDLLASLLTGINPRNEEKGGPPLYEQLRERAGKAADQLDAESVGDAQAVARLQTILGNTLRELGDFPKAIAVLEKASVTQARELGDDHPDTLTARNHLAGAYQAAGKLQLAIPLLERTLKACEAKLGDDDPDTLTARNNLALAYQAAGRLDWAIPLYERALKAKEAKLGDDHPSTLATRNNLALAYLRTGKLELAIPLFERTVKAFEAQLGDDHPNTLTSRHNLASAYHAAGKLELAIPLFERALKAKEAKLGDDHPDTLTARNNLALAYQEAGKLDRALPLFERAALGMEKRRFQHEQARGIIANTIGAYEAAQQWDKAESWRRKWLAFVKEQAGASSPAYGGELAVLGFNLLRQKKWAAAEAPLRECLAIRAKTQPDVWSTFNTKSLLGGALLGQKKYADAEPLLLAGYEGMKQREKTIPPQGQVRLPEALDRLIELSTATHKPDEAKKWQAERAKYPEAGPLPGAKK